MITFRFLLYKILGFFLLTLFLSTSCEYGLFFESRLPSNSAFAVYGLRRADDEMDFLGLARMEYIDDSASVYGGVKYAGGRREANSNIEKYDSVKIVLLPDSLYWKFPYYGFKTISGKGTGKDK